MKLGRPPITDRHSRARILRLKRQGHTLRDIADQVDVSVGTVHKIVKAAEA